MKNIYQSILGLSLLNITSLPIEIWVIPAELPYCIYITNILSDKLHREDEHISCHTIPNNILGISYIIVYVCILHITYCIVYNIVYII